jgi:hypothetical protein
MPRRFYWTKAENTITGQPMTKITNFTVKAEYRNKIKFYLIVSTAAIKEYDLKTIHLFKKTKSRRIIVAKLIQIKALNGAFVFFADISFCL